MWPYMKRSLRRLRNHRVARSQSLNFFHSTEMLSELWCCARALTKSAESMTGVSIRTAFI